MANETIPQFVYRLSKGNPGAVSCIALLISPQQDLVSGASKEKREETLAYLDAHSIIGTDLYVLWSDISGRNLDVMHYIISNAPVDKVKLAASKQDYSGKEILDQWLKGYKIANRS